MFWWRFLQRIGETQIGLLAAGVAFYALLAVFPAMAAVIALAGLFTDPQAVVGQLEGIAALLPDEAATILLDQAVKIAGAGESSLSLALWVGLGFATYLSTRATTGLIHGMNVVHGRDETRGVFRYWSTVVLLTLALLVGTALLFTLLVVTPAALSFFPDQIFSIEVSNALRGWRWILVAIVFALGLSFLYRMGPCGWCARWWSAGLVVATVLWFAGSYAFAYYVAQFGYYNESFGSLGGVIILLTWLWLSAYVVLLGALLDAERDAAKG